MSVHDRRWPFLSSLWRKDSGGRSNFITYCTIEDGNPADTDLIEKVLDRQNEIYF
jgi:hypothetical protein